jgi:hypothetical protein
VIVAGDGSEQRLDLATRVVKRDKFVEVTTIQGIKSPASQLHVPRRHASDVLHLTRLVASALGSADEPPIPSHRGHPLCAARLVCLALVGTRTFGVA